MAITESTTRYRETLLPGVSVFLATGILFPSVLLVFLPINPTVGWVSASVLTVFVWLALFLRAPKIVVTDTVLQVAEASIPLKLLGNATEIPKDQRFAERTQRLDSRAFVRFQVGIEPLVRVEIEDSKDPTPYWLFSTRKPSELLRAIEGE